CGRSGDRSACAGCRLWNSDRVDGDEWYRGNRREHDQCGGLIHEHGQRLGIRRKSIDVRSLTVTIITLNEADHIAAAIESASFADEILVVDSGSRDATVDIARGKGARVLTRQWTGYVDQKNYATDQAACDWIFSLDADERIP